MTSVKQLVLDLIAPPAPTFDNFIPGQNREAVLALRALCAGDTSHRLMYCWGATSAGKTHLVTACVRASTDVTDPAHASHSTNASPSNHANCATSAPPDFATAGDPRIVASHMAALPAAGA